MTEEKSLEEQVKELKQAIAALVELEKARAQKEIAKVQAQVEIETKKEMDEAEKQALKEELKQIDLGELVRYAIKKDLIPRGSASDKE